MREIHSLSPPLAAAACPDFSFPAKASDLKGPSYQRKSTGLKRSAANHENQSPCLHIKSAANGNHEIRVGGEEGWGGGGMGGGGMKDKMGEMAPKLKSTACT